MAHELGHNHGRFHTACGGAAGTAPNNPYPGGIIGVTGWDAPEGRLLPGSGWRDLMSYCGPSWVSDYQLQAFHEFSQGLGRSLRGAAAAAKPRGGSLYVQGTIEGGRVASLRVLRLPESAPRPQSGDWTLEARGGGQVHRASFSPVALDHRPGVLGFSVFLPALAQLEQLRVLERGVLRHSRGAEGAQARGSRKAEALQVRDLRLARDGRGLRWAESAPSGAQLRRIVRASYDGGLSFEVLAMDAPAGRLDRLELGGERRGLRRSARGSQRLALARAAGGSVLIEVQLSDGLQTVAARLAVGR
jgi:hypothetical protein